MKRPSAAECWLYAQAAVGFVAFFSLVGIAFGWWPLQFVLLAIGIRAALKRL